MLILKGKCAITVALAACVLAGIAGCGDNDPSGNDDGIVAERFTSEEQFQARLGSVNIVDFDDIDASGSDQVAFDPERYLDSEGIIITGEDGQFVSEDFGYPIDFPPVSSPNSFAPGAVSEPFGGGNETQVTFGAGAADALTSGFGLWFTDADYATDGPCSLAVYNSASKRVGLVTGIETGDGGHAFCGIVMIDEATDEPVAVISRVKIVNGQGWPGGDDNEGVCLDDFRFGSPVEMP